MSDDDDNGSHGLFAPLSLLEQHLADDRQFQTEASTKLATIESCTSHTRTEIHNIKRSIKPKPFPVWRWIGLLVVILPAVGAALWYIANLPSPTDWKDNQTTIKDIQLQQVDMHDKIDAIKSSLDRIERVIH